MQLYYLENSENKSQKKIGDEMGISGEGVRYLLAKAIRKMLPIAQQMKPRFFL